MAEDEDLACAVLEQRFWISDSEVLRRAVGNDGHPQFGFDHCNIQLDPSQIEVFVAELCADRAFLKYENVWLTDWSSLRDVPYLVHTGFELFLMLEGRKKLAQFCDMPDWLEDHLRPFDRFVSEGRLVKRVLDEPVPEKLQAVALRPHTHVTRVLYALPGEEWRIDAFLLMWELCKGSGWNETIERFEGGLYGYESWQMEWWITHTREKLAEYRRERAEEARSQASKT